MTSRAYPWPDGKRAALCVSFDMDAEAAVLAVDETFSRRPSVMSHQQYGPVTGVPRLLEMLGDLEVRASFFIPGFSAERHPGTVGAIAEAGHEICHHGWWETSTATFDLLLEYGFTCDSSLFDRDVPYRMGIGSSELVEVPVSWALDDWEKYAFLPDPPTGSGVIESPARVHEIWWEEIQAYLDVGGCCVLTMHPFLSGRPARVRALRELLEKAATRSDLWITTVGEVAAHCAGADVPVHPLSLPTVGSGPAEPVPGS